MNRGYQTASKKYREQNSGDTASNTSSNSQPPPPSGAPAGGMPDFSFLLGSLGGSGRGAGAGGGMPDLAGLMNNPMLMNMAQQMTSSDAFNDILNNPRMRELAQQMMTGQRNIGDLMSDPDVQNLYSLSNFVLTIIGLEILVLEEAVDKEVIPVHSVLDLFLPFAFLDNEFTYLYPSPQGLVILMGSDK
jgi:hypothetical protein